MQLSKFTTFVNDLYPHELKYIESIENFKNRDVLKILDRIRFNLHNPDKTKEYFSEIDKRKYSYLMKWIKKSLELADIDVFFGWIIKMEKDINMDNVLPEDEIKLLKYTKSIRPGAYFFMKFYEMLNVYRDYLLIRTRVLYYESIQLYLQKYEPAYTFAVDLNRKMNKSAVDIINQHINSKGDSFQWVKFLTETFNNKSIDGFTRYKAFVRLTYIYYNYRKFRELRDIYAELDKVINTPAFYSKRILANYYSNVAMMYSMLREMDKAEYFAYLSVRQKNSDYLFYLIKLCNILLIREKNEIALKVLKENLNELNITNNTYNKIGLIAMYIKALNKNGNFAEAEKYGDNFMRIHKKELFNFRWHIFFRAYLMSLLKQEKYSKLLSISKRYKLVQKEKKFFGKARYIPTILWYFSLAQYMEGIISDKKLQGVITLSQKSIQNNKYLSMKTVELQKELFDFHTILFKTL